MGVHPRLERRSPALQVALQEFNRPSPGKFRGFAIVFRTILFYKLMGHSGIGVEPKIHAGVLHIALHLLDLVAGFPIINVAVMTEGPGLDPAKVRLS